MGGGGGAGLGGDVFVQHGGNLTFAGGVSRPEGAVTGGAAGSSGNGVAGQAYGQGIFIQGYAISVGRERRRYARTVPDRSPPRGRNDHDRRSCHGRAGLQPVGNHGGLGRASDRKRTSSGTVVPCARERPGRCRRQHLYRRRQDRKRDPRACVGCRRGQRVAVVRASYGRGRPSSHRSIGDVQAGDAFTFAKTIDGFGANSVIDLKGLAFNSDHALDTVSENGSTLTLSNGTITDTLTVDDLPSSGVVVGSDGDGGTEVFASLADAIGVADASPSPTNWLALAPGTTVETADMPAVDLASGVTLTIDGEGDFSGAGEYRGLFDYAGALSVENLTIAHARAVGGGGSAGGGGGAGLGGGLFVAATGAVMLTNVAFSDDSATGGAGGAGNFYAGGGGGLGGAGGRGNSVTAGGGGGVGVGANGGTLFTAGGGGSGVPGIIQRAADGGGGGNAGVAGGDGGGVGAVSGTGGFGGGGGGGEGEGSPGGFGGGGGGGTAEVPGFAPYGGGAAGGFGGGGGGGATQGGAGGFGAGGGHTGGGGGLGAGGDVFVQQGGSLTVAAASLSGTANPGAGNSGGANGESFGGGLFIQGGATEAPSLVTLGAGQIAGQTTTISGVISDQDGAYLSLDETPPAPTVKSADGTPYAGVGGLIIEGHGTVALAADNTFRGGIELESGALELQAVGAGGYGEINFAANAAKLTIGESDTPADGQTFANVIAGFTPGRSTSRA